MFVEARNKLEAVARISNLTNSGPEFLGPGSKEHKSVFLNLALGLGISHEPNITKHALAAKILESLGGEWSSEYESYGATVTLKGLNALLTYASRHLEIDGRLKTSVYEASFEQELRSVSQIVVEHTPLQMDGKLCVEEMKLVEDSNWRQTEWQGFYFEMKIEAALTNIIGGGHQKFFNTQFDYVRNYIWDLKMHSSRDKSGNPNNTLILNDTRAMNQAVEERGLGFIILTALPTYDLDFTRWHKQFRGGGIVEPTRILKSSFISERIDIFYIPDTQSLQRAIQSEQLAIMAQGKNSNGKSRPTKYSLDLKKICDSNLQVFSHIFA